VEPGARLLRRLAPGVNRVVFEARYNFLYVFEGQLIFDPTTSAVLQYQAVVAAPVGNGLAVSGSRPTPLPDGTVINYTVYLTTGIANTDSSVPGAASQQG